MTELIYDHDHAEMVEAFDEGDAKLVKQRKVRKSAAAKIEALGAPKGVPNHCSEKNAIVLAARIMDLPRFRGEMRAWDQALWLCVMLSSGFVAFFSSTPAELFFRPDPRTDGAAARSGGQGRPLAAAARRACP